MTRFEELVAVVERHQALAAENYDRVRGIAEHIRGGFCEYLAANDGDCVHLAPPIGPFEPRDYGDEAFSLPPNGLRPVGPVVFGLAVRVTKTGDWMRLALQCVKEGEHFTVHIAEGKSHEFTLPLGAKDDEIFYAMLHQHLLESFTEQIDAYEDGDYGGGDIGFHMNVALKPGELKPGERPGDAVVQKDLKPAPKKARK